MEDAKLCGAAASTVHNSLLLTTAVTFWFHLNRHSFYPVFSFITSIAFTISSWAFGTIGKITTIKPTLLLYSNNINQRMGKL